MAIKNGHCSLCNTYTQDLPKHLIYIYTVLQCQKWLHIRNCMFYKIVDPPLSPQMMTYVRIFTWGYKQHNEINGVRFIVAHNRYMSILYYNIKHVLQFHTCSFYLGCTDTVEMTIDTRGGSRVRGRAHPARGPPKIGKNMIFLRKIVIFHTKYPKNFRASLRSAQFF